MQQFAQRVLDFECLRVIRQSLNYSAILTVQCKALPLHRYRRFWKFLHASAGRRLITTLISCANKRDDKEPIGAAVLLHSKLKNSEVMVFNQCKKIHLTYTRKKDCNEIQQNSILLSAYCKYFKAAGIDGFLTSASQVCKLIVFEKNIQVYVCSS